MKNKIEKLVRPNILSLQPYISFRDTFNSDDWVKLDANENPFGDYNRYPDSTQKKLKERVSQIKNVPASQIAIGNGSDELIDLIIKIFCQPSQDAVMVMKPSFAMYEFYANINQNKVIHLDLNSNFELSKEEFLTKSKASQAKVLFLCSPNNPTGNSIDDLEFYIENFDGIVVVDEAYIEFSDKESILAKINQFENLIVLQTLSKAWGLAGLRIGMAFASEYIIGLFNRTKSPYNISELNLKTAIKELSNREVFKIKLNNISLQKQNLKAALTEIKIVDKIYPSDANFLLIEVNQAEKVYQTLIDNRVLTSKRFPSILNALRITVGSNDENEKLIKILKSIQL